MTERIKNTFAPFVEEDPDISYSSIKQKSKKKKVKVAEIENSAIENANIPIQNAKAQKKRKASPANDEPNSFIEEEVKTTSTVMEQIINVEKKIKAFVGHISQAPEFMFDNDYIHTGYRINFGNTKQILKSLFMVHNESVNVWSHIGGAIFFIALIVYTVFYFAPAVIYPAFAMLKHKFVAFIDEQCGHHYGPNSTNIINYPNELINLWSSEFESLTNSSSLIQGSKSRFEFAENLLVESVQGLMVTLLAEITNLRYNITCAPIVKEFFTNLENLPEAIQAKISELTGTVLNAEKIESNLKLKFVSQLLNTFKGTMIDIREKIDSPDLDWVEFGTKIDSDSRRMNLSGVTRWPLLLQLMSAVICLSCSAIYHLFSAHSDNISSVFARLDYAGISILIMGSCIPPNYYSFYCLPTFMYIYLTVIVTMCTTAFIVTLLPRFDYPEYRKWRGIMFVTVGVSSAFPVVHMIFFNDGEYMMNFNPTLLGIGGAFYVLGAFIYILRFPERLFPGKFDIIGSSHQIWHFFILTAAITHYCASIEIYHTRKTHLCPI